MSKEAWISLWLGLMILIVVVARVRTQRSRRREINEPMKRTLGERYEHRARR